MTRPRLLVAVALGAIGLAFAMPLQSPGCPQTAHYAAIRAFAQGRPFIDRYEGESCDIVHTGGHYYAAKAPALDFWSLPWYLLLRSAGAIPRNPNAGMGFPAEMAGVSERALWQIGLWAVVLPALGLLVILRRTVERLEPGLGTATAAILGLGTLVLPFSTLLFPQVPAAALAFGSFALLFGREAGPRRVAAAGAAAGLAVSTDLPFVLPAAALGLYAAAGAPHVRRLLAFTGGGIVGLAPLLLLDWWAFRNPFHTPYSGVAVNPGAGGVELSPEAGHGFFSLHAPSARVAVELLLSPRGLLVLTPVVAAAAAGVVLLRRRGLRRESWLVAGLSVTAIAVNSGRGSLELALGGWSPGPRYLVALLPFLCFAIAPALRRRPATVGVLALASAAAMAIATSAEPLLQNNDTRHWLSRIGHGNFTATVLTLGGVGHGWLAIAPFGLFVLAGAAAAIAGTRLPVARRDLVTAAAAIAGWLIVRHSAPELLRVDRAVHQSYGVVTAVLLVAACTWAVLRLRPAGLPLLAFATIRTADHTKWALLLVVLVLAGLALSERVRRPPVPA